MIEEQDVRDWEQLPLPSSIITSSHFGAWLYYRDKRRDKIVNSELLDKVARKFISWDSKVKGIREDGVCFFTIENILNGIEELKEEVQNENS